tara:strand:- start:749 stop:1525 length:777 start_codon:yes stop_codon:yes gene_type:complete
MKNALIGHSGFIGKNIKKIRKFHVLYNSKNINKIKKKNFNIVFCCGLPSLMWKANKYPIRDLNNVLKLTKNLSTISCKKFILISSVEIYDHRFSNTEKKFVFKKNKLSYGYNRLFFEKFVESKFSNVLILRMPVIYGKYLKKNILYDIINLNNLSNINLEDQLQFYNIKNIFKDIKICNNKRINKINLVSAPIKVKKLIKILRPELIEKCKKDIKKARKYNIKSIHSRHFRSSNNYIISKKSALLDIIRFYNSQKNNK